MKSRVKVIELIQQISEGGAETLVKDYAVHLNDDIFDVTILTEFPLTIKSANVQILLERGKRIKAPFGVSKETFFEKIIRKLRKSFIPKSLQDRYRARYVKQQICRIKPDVIHVHTKMLKYLPELSDELKGAKLFYTCHSLPSRYLNDDECKNELEAARFLIIHNGLRMIGLHNAMKNELNAMFHVDNSLVINNCIDIARFKNIKETKDSIREYLGIPGEAFVLGHVGRFVPLKNQSFIIDVFYRVLKKNNNAYLLLIGDGNKSDAIRKIKTYDIGDRCIILSQRKDIPQLLKAMDVFIFPSQFEGLGIACVEAQAVGLRCVISDAIPREVYFSENAIPMSLSENPQRWADVILDSSIKGTYNNDIDRYDINAVMQELTNIYTE